LILIGFIEAVSVAKARVLELAKLRFLSTYFGMRCLKFAAVVVVMFE
jgi:hypothetical protein